MSLAIQHCAPINNDNSDNNYDDSLNNKNLVNQTRRNKTYKNNKINHEKSRELMQHIARDGYNQSTNSDDDTDDIMGNFMYILNKWLFYTKEPYFVSILKNDNGEYEQKEFVPEK